MSAFTFKDQAFLAGLAAGGVTPASFPGLARWWKADSYTGIANDGDAVGGGTNPRGPWVDNSVTGDDATSAGNGPVFKTAIVGTKPILRFATSAGAFLSFAEATLTDFTVIAASARTAGIGASSFIVEHDTNNHQISRAYIGSNEIVWYAGGATISDTGLSGAATDFMVTTVRRSAGAVTLRQNKTAVGGGADANNFIINQIGFSGLGSEMDYGELLIYTSALSDADVDQLYDEYLKPRWTTLP